VSYPPRDDPSVSVVIATRGRPELLRCAIRAAFGQDFGGRVEVIVVFDQIDLDPLADVVVPPMASLVPLVNARAAGLAGARNTGILASTAEVVAFCDDDDEWMPTKLRSQFALWRDNADAILVATGIRIETGERAVNRVPPARARFEDLLVSRITELHPSTFLMMRDDLLARIGLVDEELPASYGEDYDLLLRASRISDVVAVAEPLVVVRWNRSSFFAGRWQGIADGLRYLLRKYPEFGSTPTGSARLEGQIAFALAALGARREARDWARRAIRHDRSQLRGYAAYLIAAGVVPAGLLVAVVNRRGRGL
jgi:glycosyltransferase involved in cell wall biosynthesis